MKIDNNMRKLKFNDIYDFVGYYLETCEKIKSKDRFANVTIYAKYEQTKKIIKALIECDVEIHAININDPSWNGYIDEYVISLSNDGLYVDEAKLFDGYIENYCTYAFIFGDCNSNEILKKCECYDEAYEIDIGYKISKEDLENGKIKLKAKNIKLDDFYVNCNGDKLNIIGVDIANNKHNTLYTVNGKEVSRDEYEDNIKKVNNRIDDIFRSFDLFGGAWF